MVICCGKKAKSELEEIIRGAGYHATLSEDRTVFKFIICDQSLCSFLKGFGCYAIGKKLSGQCFNLEYERKKALYEGYFSADGYAGKNGAMQTTTISAELTAGIAQIARDVLPEYLFTYIIRISEYQNTQLEEYQNTNLPDYLLDYS